MFFWIVSNSFDKKKYDVSIVILNSKNQFFNKVDSSINVIDLGTVRASKSFFAISKLLITEKPFAVFTTGGQVDILVAIVSFFVQVPFLIARSTSIPGERIKFANRKSKFLGRALNLFSFYNRFDKIVCQTAEMKAAWEDRQSVDVNKLVVIPNPVIFTNLQKKLDPSESNIKLITVGSLSEVKGHNRLLEILTLLPQNYSLTLAGAGLLHDKLSRQIHSLKLSDRVTMTGQIKDVLETVIRHDVFVLTSFVEGFPNVALEALSVGVPVVAFRVSGISELIVDGFNGYIVEQGDLEGFRDKLLLAGSKTWDPLLIGDDVCSRYSIGPIVDKYERLISNTILKDDI